MAREFRLPDLGEGVHEGEILSVLVSVGDQVREDQPILEVETDKAAVEIPSPFAGIVTAVAVQEGDLVRVGDLLIAFDDALDAGVEASSRQDAPVALAEEPAPAAEEPGLAAEEPAPEEPAPVTPGLDRPPEPVYRQGPVAAAPSTRRLARELGVDLRQVPGSGPGGRVTAGDVHAFAETGHEEPAEEPRPVKPAPAEEWPAASGLPELPDFSRWGEVERVPLRSVRRATARHMALAWEQIPHVSHQDVADVTKLEALRQKQKDRIAAQGGSLTLTVFVLKAAVAALKAYPRFNASLDVAAQEIILKKHYHIGLAVDTERGLLVPVLHDVDRKSVAELAIELSDLVARTRAGKASLEELQGGTFTITNPGPLGGTGFAAIVNYPEVAILGMARASWQPVVRGKGKKAAIVPRFILPLVLSFDHRVVDGADAARFVNLIVELLQDPGRLLMGL
jgi:pyruvate dehydrogenase E2 component (dihydrolipoamide acetyltransferase)